MLPGFYAFGPRRLTGASIAITRPKHRQRRVKHVLMLGKSEIAINESDPTEQTGAKHRAC